MAGTYANGEDEWCFGRLVQIDHLVELGTLAAELRQRLHGVQDEARVGGRRRDAVARVEGDANHGPSGIARHRHEATLHRARREALAGVDDTGIGVGHRLGDHHRHWHREEGALVRPGAVEGAHRRIVHTRRQSRWVHLYRQ